MAALGQKTRSRSPFFNNLNLFNIVNILNNIMSKLLIFEEQSTIYHPQSDYVANLCIHKVYSASRGRAPAIVTFFDVRLTPSGRKHEHRLFTTVAVLLLILLSWHDSRARGISKFCRHEKDSLFTKKVHRYKLLVIIEI